MTRCPPGCTCRKHHTRTPEERARTGQANHAAATRRRHTRYHHLGLGTPVHQPCSTCGRLLAPNNGEVPEHRTPAKPTNGHTPLTGTDQPLCGGTTFAPEMPYAATTLDA